MKRIAFAAICAAALLPGLGGCRAAEPTTSASTPEPAAAAPSGGSRGRVHLDPSQLKEVRIDELSNHAPEDSLKATGTIEFNGDHMAKLLPPVAGQVQSLNVNVGDTLRKNDIVFVLSSREVAAAIADHTASHKDLDLAEKTFAMTKDLYEHQAASRMSLEQAESELAKARSKVQHTEEVLRVLGVDPEVDAPRWQSRIPVRAPIGGTVIERSVTNGQFVGPDNPPLLTIADLSSLWVQADVFERDLRNISVGQKADVATAAYPNDRFSAQVARIGAVVDPQTRTSKVRFLVANPGARLKPGMFASVNLYLPETASTLTVPAKAVFVENSRTFAYVQVGPQEFSRREIDTVATGGERLRVTRGLQAGDRVVSDGVLLLRQLESDSSGQ